MNFLSVHVFTISHDVCAILFCNCALAKVYFLMTAFSAFLFFSDIIYINLEYMF